MTEMAKKPRIKDGEESKETAPSAKPSGGLLGFVIVAVASLVSSLGVFYFLTPGAQPETLACAPSQSNGRGLGDVAPLAEGQIFVEVKEMVITVGSAPANRFLKLNLSVVTRPEHAERVKAAEPMLLDAFNNYLRTVELSDLEDPRFYTHLRSQLSRRAELVIGNSASNGVLITEFLLR